MSGQVSVDEKSDGLDIVSIGKLYQGPWEKKYWSSSRGKDRHPYPVGYVAHRANNGNTYKMAVLEGLKGPEFTISSTDGQSCSGQTPDIAWEGFQKKSCVRIKFWRGKRFSCKIDGAELFGFKNSLVTRLLRGLKANVTQIKEQSLPPSKVTDEHDSDLEVKLVKTESKGKRSKKRKEVNVKSVSETEQKKGRSQDHYSENENNTNLETMVCKASNTIDSKDLISIEEGTNLLKNQENLDVSMFNHTPGLTSLKIEDEKGDQPAEKDSQMLDTMDLYAPDTLDLTLDSTCNPEVDILKKKLNSSQILVSEMIDNSEKSDSDPAGQDITNSMMTLLLPKALPLLKTFSRRKKKGADKCLKDKNPAKTHIPDKLLTENSNLNKHNEDVLLTYPDTSSVAPDSFENDQSEFMKYSHAKHTQDAVKFDQDEFGRDLSTYKLLHVCPDIQPSEEIKGVSGGIMSSMPAVNHEVDGLTSILQGQTISQHDESAKVGPNDNIFELVSCYVHPTPISMVMLRTKGNEVFICVLCGMEKDKTLFIYKAYINGERKGCPSFIGHTTIISPISRNSSGTQVMLDSSSLQFTPDGKCLVLLNNIKAPYCREGSMNCGCSTCTSDCFEKNAVKVVQVKLGYVQVVCKLKTNNNICSILVSEPNYLIAAEESGNINLWTMNSTWSAPTDQGYLPSSDCMPNCIIEMKRIPNFPSLIVGHTAFGDFFLWNLNRRILISKFSAPNTASLPFIPINIFRCPNQASFTTDASRRKVVAEIMEETHNNVSLPVNEEDDVSLVLLLHDDDEYSYKDSGSWSLALLAKNKILSENTLDPSATVAGASAGYGIMGTSDGSLYIWELSTGANLGYLTHCKGGILSCLVADDSDSGVFAVAVGGSQLQVYAPGKSVNKKHE